LDNLKLIEDTYVEVQQPTPQGAGQLLKISNLGANTKSFSHIRVNSQFLGLHSNSSIIDADLNLVRSSNSQFQQQISVHTTTNNWVEGQATISSPLIGQTWTNGGISDISTSVDHSFLSDQGQPEFDFDISYPMQRGLSSLQNNPLNLVLLAEPTSALTNSQLAEINFHSTESATTNSPSIEITYQWANNASVTQPELVFPVNNQATWNVSGGNISGNTMPNFQWDTNFSQFSGSVLEISTDSYFKNVIMSIDERTSQTNSLAAEAYQLSTQEHLEIGKQYFWRVLNFDNDSLTSEWGESSFFVSNLVSTWLGGDQHKLTISPADEPDLSNIPDFDHSVISSAFPDTNSYGYPYLYVNDNPSQGVSKTIFGISLENYVLPSGLAVISSEFSMVVAGYSNSPEVGLWSLNNSDWVASEVTWNQYDATNAWNSPGASSQLDRTTLLDKQQISSSGQVSYNITSEVQMKMRQSQSLDLMLEIMPGYSNSNVLFGSKYSAVPNMPSLELIYVEGSNQIPSTPVALSPLDGQWLYNDSFLLEPNTIPELNWTVSTNPPISGWALEIDSNVSFSSNDKISVESWNDVGFDVVNSTYQLQTSLDIGKTWYWKVRGLTQTFQLGDWSPEFRFYLPDQNLEILSNDIINTSYSNSSVLEESSFPYFVDMDLSTSFLQPDPASNLLEVGTEMSGYDSIALIKIPLEYDLNPNNSRLTSATLSLYSESFSTQGLDIALREVLVPWTTDANNLQYNSSSNWSQLGGRGIGSDIGAPVDIQSSVNGLMTFNLTYLAQQALQSGESFISVCLYAESSQPGNLVYFASSNSVSDRPTINFTWERGAVNPPAELPDIITPVPGDIYFNESSHALIPSLRPSFSWSMPANSVSNPDNWRIFIILNSTNDMAGQLMFDSRDNPEYFDLINNIFTPPVDISHANMIEWYVQPLESDMIGIPSNISSYYIPNSVGQELSSTDASLTIQDGSILEELNLPELTSNIYLDEGNPNSPNMGDSLMIGNSSILNTPSSTSSAIVSFNMSLLTQLTDFQVLNATLVMTALSGSGTVDVSASRMLTYWDENSTFSNSSSGNPWINPGALRGGDSDIPESLTQVTSFGQHQWDITHMLQMLVESGSPELSILLQPEIILSNNGLINGNYEFAGSDNPTVSLRPKIELNYRVGHQWLPPAPNSLTPPNNSTIWNQNTDLPSTPNEINYTVSSSISNETSWTFCRGFDYRWLDCESTDELSTDDYVWDSVSNTLSFNNTSEIRNQAGDEWQFYRVRTNQNHNMGYYSPINKIRLPVDQGSDDGLGNYTIEFTRASIFDFTGILPQTEDSSVDSIGNAITGGDNSLIIGYNPSTGGQSAAYVEFNLSSIPFIPNAMPTSMILELTSKNSLVQQNPITIGIQSCESTDEYSTNYTNSPNCAGTELTRTTVSSSANPKVQWDVTYLAQQNFLAQNMTFSFKLEPTTVSSTYFEFLSSENQIDKPKLILTYVDNIAGLTPPSQPTLISPVDSEILYDTTGIMLQTVGQTSL
ncbi:MAG TPA: DNRLRE domain-containing protein, partial [Candidatus Poseidoniaceae archaeon]|nr:DNRLRE domain-containing protein [Candidatus Poseidoniaceae archaeon]